MTRLAVIVLSMTFLSLPAAIGEDTASGAVAATPPSQPNGEQAATTAPSSQKHYWQSLTTPQGFLSLAYLSQDTDNPYRGFRLSGGLINEFPFRRALVRRNELDSWLSLRQSDDQDIWSAGLAFDVFYAPAWGPARLVPRASAGLEYRTAGSNDGLGAFVGVGVALDIWLGRHVAISLGIERQYCYPGSDNNQVGFSIRFASDKIPALIPTV